MRLHKRDALPGHEQEVMSRRPEPHDAVAVCVKAWHDLSTERPMAIASGTNGSTFWTRVQYGPIPWTAVMSWCDRHGLEPDNAMLVWSAIGQLDAARIERESSDRRLNGGV